MDATNARARPMPVKTFGDSPVAAKDFPIFCNAGFKNHVNYLTMHFLILNS